MTTDSEGSWVARAHTHTHTHTHTHSQLYSPRSDTLGLTSLNVNNGDKEQIIAKEKKQKTKQWAVTLSCAVLVKQQAGTFQDRCQKQPRTGGRGEGTAVRGATTVLARPRSRRTITVVTLQNRARIINLRKTNCQEYQSLCKLHFT